MSLLGSEKREFDVADYWESRYRSGRTSGSGSYNRLAKFKSEFVNRFVSEKDVVDVLELGCGDGAQLALMQYPNYVGLDISKTIVEKCKTEFSNDSSKKFFHYNPDDFDCSRHKVDLSLSLDVIYHLSNDEVYRNYLNHLFAVSMRYVIIFSNSQNLYMKGVNEEAHYVRFRKFDEDIEKWFPDWNLIQLEPNFYPFNLSLPDDTSFADFYVYAHANENIESLLPLENSYSSFLQKKLLQKQNTSAEQCQVIIDAVNSLGNKLRDIDKKLSVDNAKLSNSLWQFKNLSILQSLLKIKNPTYILQADSFDILLKIHAHVRLFRPRVVVQLGSGASTVVIADALRQNGLGRLTVVDTSDHSGEHMLTMLQQECLENWVDLRVGDLDAWEGEHLGPKGADKSILWYPISLLTGIDNVDLLFVDGPPKATCPFSRYPALPALADKLSPNAEVWMDDVILQEDKDICERWAKEYNFELEHFSIEKGLARLTRPGSNKVQTQTLPMVVTQSNDLRAERILGLDFSLPEDKA